MKENQNKPAKPRKKQTRGMETATDFISLGKVTVISAICMEYALADKDTPAQARCIIKAALAYAKQPSGARAGVFPERFLDDVGVLTAAASIVAKHIKPEHRKKAETDFANTFGVERSRQLAFPERRTR